jgi:hypothetical protein
MGHVDALSSGFMWVVRACERLSEAAKTLTTRDHVRDISGTSTPLNTNYIKQPARRATINVSDSIPYRARGVW